MKISKEFVLREIAGEYVIVPIGRTTLDFNGIITVNDIGKFLWENMQDDFDEETLLAKVLDEYDVDEDTAMADIREFVDKLKENNIISFQ